MNYIHTLSLHDALPIFLNDLGVKSKPLTGYQAGIETVGHHLKSKISKINTDLFEQLFGTYDVLIVAGFQGFNGDRSEEHTSELQSRGQLVCRLLLEKKK